ncbi:MAG: NACHT domain-containing protein, partial [Pseudomonadota bacterium]
MSDWTFETVALTVLGAAFLGLLGYVIWLRYRMRYSKAHFAFFVVTTQVLNLTTFLFFVSSPFTELVNSILTAVGFEARLQSVGPWQIIPGLIATLIISVTISSFARAAIRNWEGPHTVAVNKLQSESRADDLMALAYAQAQVFAQRSKDPEAGAYARGRGTQTSEAPSRPSAHSLAQAAFQSAYSEAVFPDNAWRDASQSLVGEMYAGATANKVALFVMVFDEAPTRDDVAQRLAANFADAPIPTGARLFAVHSGDRGQEEEIKVAEATVKVLSVDHLLRKHLNLTKYARELLTRFDEESVGGTDVKLANTFVPSRATALRSGAGAEEDPIDLRSMYEDWVAEDSRQHLLILGDYGQGKSTAMLALCAEWARRYLDNPSIDERVPLLIELRSKSPGETEPRDFLASWANRFDLQADRIFNLIQHGKAIVIFEGFDEIKNAGRAFDRHEHFNALWQFAYPGTKLIFTGRPNFFLDDLEKNRTLRVDASAGAAGNAHTRAWTLEPLSIDEIEEVCRNFEPETRKGIITAARSDVGFYDLVSRPSMIPVVATIWGEIKELQATGHRLTGAVLIERYLDAIYRRKEAELERDRVERQAPAGSAYIEIPREIRDAITLMVAWKMVVLGQKNTVMRSQITQLIDDFYDKIVSYAQADGVAAHVAKAMMDFEDRYREETRGDRLERITNQVVTTGILINDPAAGPSNLRFPHKQFFEFYVAKAFWFIRSFNESHLAEMLDEIPRERNIWACLLSERGSIIFLRELSAGKQNYLRRGLLWTAITILQLQFIAAGAWSQQMVRKWIFAEFGNRRDEIEDTDSIIPENASEITLGVNLLDSSRLSISFLFSFIILIMYSTIVVSAFGESDKFS